MSTTGSHQRRPQRPPMIPHFWLDISPGGTHNPSSSPSSSTATPSSNTASLAASLQTTTPQTRAPRPQTAIILFEEFPWGAYFAVSLEPFVQKTENFRVQWCQRVKDPEGPPCDKHAPRTLEEREGGVGVSPALGCFRNVGVAD